MWQPRHRPVWRIFARAGAATGALAARPAEAEDLLEQLTERLGVHPEMVGDLCELLGGAQDVYSGSFHHDEPPKRLVVDIQVVVERVRETTPVFRARLVLGTPSPACPRMALGLTVQVVLR